MRSSKSATRATWLVLILIGMASLGQVLGMVLPGTHVATSRIALQESPEAVWAALATPEAQLRWRDDLDRVEMKRGGTAWIEWGVYGRVPMVREGFEPPHRLVTRVASDRVGFTATWRWEVEAAGDGATVTLTEVATLENPGHRVLTRLFLGKHEMIDGMLADLGDRFDEHERPEHVE